MPPTRLHPLASRPARLYLEFKMTPRTAARTSYGEKTDTALKLFVVLSRAHRAMAEHARRDEERHGLSSTAFGVLEALYHKGQLLIGEVSEKILLTSGSTTYVVDRLEERGLVRRVPASHDRRATYLELTAEGERFIGKIFPVHAETLTAAAAGLTLQEQKTAISLLRKLGKAAEEEL
jgi:MarR family transcriptional regulator, 2-MHQ and catechol-resistance regulon repressor